eukprot:5362243-Pyramimonas_sp.AAC.1
MVSALVTVATRSRRASRRLTTTIPRASASLQWLQVDDELIFALEGTVTNAAEFQFQAVRSHPIPWDSCIRTGSVEGPPLWNAQCISMFGP